MVIYQDFMELLEKAARTVGYLRYEPRSRYSIAIGGRWNVDETKLAGWGKLCNIMGWSKSTLSQYRKRVGLGIETVIPSISKWNQAVRRDPQVAKKNQALFTYDPTTMMVNLVIDGQVYNLRNRKDSEVYWSPDQASGRPRPLKHIGRPKATPLEVRVDFGNLVRQALKSRRVRQSKLGAFCDLSQPTVSRIVSGTGKSDDKVREKIRMALGIETVDAEARVYRLAKVEDWYGYLMEMEASTGRVLLDSERWEMVKANHAPQEEEEEDDAEGHQDEAVENQD